MFMRGKNWIVTGIFLAGLSVVIGAFGAHGLENHFVHLAPVEYANKIDNWKTGAMYQFFHSLGIIMIGIVLSFSSLRGKRWLNVAAILMVMGILLFSGLLYLMTLTGLRLGMFVPIGGIALIVGWIAFAVGVIQLDAKQAS
jgi:uncharacterized membrane protein YgdD (TMEM256/DUF423 family)